ncbi:uncharacterized protein LOC134267234 [Saccostrea cucullata]|uniref:uncharacterized protein LOC134267234 n=1 Tax=Saccostrea cuccullata TaxID=36930 RepID=UPI002ED65E22
MPKRRKAAAAQGDPQAAAAQGDPQAATPSNTVTRKRQKTVSVQEIDYQKLAEEILKQQRATSSSASATISVPPVTNNVSNETVLTQPTLLTAAQLPTAPVQEPAPAVIQNASSNTTQQMPAITSLSTSTSSNATQQMPATTSQSTSTYANNSSTDVTVSSLVSQIFGTNEGCIQFHASSKPTTDPNTTEVIGNLSQQAHHLLSAALSNTTKSAYKRSWDLLLQFNPTVTSLPISSSVTANFIAHLFTIGYSPSSISSHISAISYLHKILGLSDPSDAFLVRKIMQGCHRSAPNKDTRLPITGPILHNLVCGLQKSVQNLHYRIMLKAIFLLAFNAFLRLGELVVKTKGSLNTVIQREEVSFEFSNNSPSAVVLLLKNFKTNKKKDLFQIHLRALDNSDMCPGFGIISLSSSL